MADDQSALESSAEALVSLKEGKGNNFQIGLSPVKREHPVRIRKPNRHIFGDSDADPSHLTPRPRKQAKTVALQKGLLSTPDKKVAQAIGMRLRNLLKLPKAHKWVCYEWFYSNIDIPLLEGENDFCICLKENFPHLKTYKLRRVEWCKIRRLMGKPRRCSSAFFAEERAVLQKKREKIRLLQQRKMTDNLDLKDLPEEIPMPLVIGTKVTAPAGCIMVHEYFGNYRKYDASPNKSTDARLRKPQDGLFTGTIDALDTVNNTYRVKFDRPNLGVHSIPDTEVLSNEPQETMPLSTFQAKHRPNRAPVFSSPRFVPNIGSPELENDPLLGASPLKGKVFTLEDGSYGGFPIKFLALVTRLSKILSLKKEKVEQLKDMNCRAEKMNSYGEAYGTHFQHEYAQLVVDLDELNKELNQSLVGVQQHCQQIAPDQGIGSVELPNDICNKCEDEAHDIVTRMNCLQSGKKLVRNERTVELVTKLTALMLQIRTFAENDCSSFELGSLQSTLQDVKNYIDPSNIGAFENHVEIHINHIQSGLSQMGNLHAFASTPAV